AFPAEAYRLRVSQARGIEMEAADERGLCWAAATLTQLVRKEGLPLCDIMDAPRYAHRGILLDSARHFFPVETVKRLIERLSQVKINTLHWHLTDDQGWRVESKRFPRLHEQCAPAYYTQDEIRDIVAYAAKRGVEIVPEIDLPGHTSTILTVYPELGCRDEEIRLETAPGIYSIILCPGKEATFQLLLPLLEEIASLFPSERFHLGGDEAPKGEWQACPHCRGRMRDEGLATAEDLQGWFTARLADHMRGLGKRVCCWNESLKAADLVQRIPDITIQHWAEMHEPGPSRRYWESGGPTIFSSYFSTYLDLPHGTVPLKRIYGYGPPQEAINALGVEACLWSELIPTPERLWVMAFPRAYALAEIAWTQAGRRDYADFRRRLALWLAQSPGPGGTPPEKADPRGLERYRERFGYLSAMKNAPRPTNNAGVGGSLDPRFLLDWFKYYLA
ncbi:MAG: beta-N-acetylhexosaminidase, partial [Oscillospiraceae bacterium]|nr:beta-N-acetylhexosaminidase [Oscillospiraceae bacterium]